MTHTRTSVYRWAGRKLELRYQEHIHYSISSNPKAAYANHNLFNTHYYRTNEISMTVLIAVFLCIFDKYKTIFANKCTVY